MKYGVKLYDEMAQNPRLFQAYVDTTFTDRYKSELWRSYFQWDILPSPDDMFKTIEVVDSGVIMADVRARFSDISQRDVDGYAFYTGTVPDLSHGFKQGVADMVKIQRLQEMMVGVTGGENVLRQLTQELSKYVGGIHARITNMAMQLLSTGKITSAGTGLSYKAKAPLPTTNFRTAGDTVWSDTDALIFDDMINTEKYVRETLGFVGALEWTVDRSTMNNILKNKQVQSYISPILIAAGIATAGSAIITESQLSTFLLDWRQISPIKVVDESQKEASIGSVSVVNGWDEGVAVLRPAGYAGVIKYSTLDELRVISGEQGVSVAYLEGGRIGIKRKFNAATERWSTDVLAACVPALTQWNYHIIVDTLTAES